VKPISKVESSPWETLASKKIYENAWYALRQDQVRTHTGEQITYTFMEHPGAVAIVPVTADQSIVLIRSYRYTVKDWCWEIPMGGRDHEDLEVVARKELLEEIGGITSNLEYISYFYANNGVSDIRCDVFLARDVEIGDNQPEDSELIEIQVLSKDEVFRMAYAGEITDGMSALSIFLCEKHL
jgi:8-oxo-dGTP pyrophosphatase MutT (NUDIX family)